MDVDQTTVVAGRVPDDLRSAFVEVGFNLLRPLGDGGMAQVYLAEDAELGRQVAIKIMRDDLGASDEFTERFVEEAQRVAGFQHNNILTVFRAGAIEGLHYIVMQLAPQGDLSGRLKKGPLPPEEAADTCARIADALAYAHAHGFVHRDLKPANVFFTEEGAPILADFGIAKSLVDPGRTHAGMVIGTPRYMSPEQRDGRPVDDKTDVYALGLVFFETLTGQLPAQRQTPAKLRRALPPGGRKYAHVIAACLNENPQLRPAAAECVKLIDRARRVGGRYRDVYLGAAAVVVLAAAAGLYLSNRAVPAYQVRLDIEPDDAAVFVDGRPVSGASLALSDQPVELAVIKRGYYGQLAEVDPETTDAVRVDLEPVGLPSAEEKQRFHTRFDDEAASLDSLTVEGLSDPVYIDLIKLRRSRLAGRDAGADSVRMAALATLGDDVSSLKLFLAATVQPPLVDVDLDVARSWVANASNPDARYAGYALASHYRALEIMQARGADGFTQLDRDTARDLFARAYAQGLDWPDQNMGWYVTMACGVPIHPSEAMPAHTPQCVTEMRSALEGCLPALAASKDPGVFLACLQQGMTSI